MSDLSPEAWQDIAAMNARVYVMSAEDRERWYREHPVSNFEDPVARTARDIAAALEEAAIADWDAGDGKVIEIYVSQIAPIVERVLKGDQP